MLQRLHLSDNRAMIGIPFVTDDKTSNTQIQSQARGMAMGGSVMELHVSVQYTGAYAVSSFWKNPGRRPGA